MAELKNTTSKTTEEFSKYKSIIISTNNSKPIIKVVDNYSEIKNTEPLINSDNSNVSVYFSLSESSKYKLLRNNQSLFLYLVTDKFHPIYRLKSRKINRKHYGILKNKTIPRGYLQSSCYKTTDVDYSFNNVSKMLIPNQYFNITAIIREITIYLESRKKQGKLFTGRYNHYCYKKHPESAYFKFYLLVAPSYNFNFNIMSNKNKREIVHSKLSIPIVVFASALGKAKYEIKLETIDDYKRGNIEKLYCLSVR